MMDKIKEYAINHKMVLIALLVLLVGGILFYALKSADKKTEPVMHTVSNTTPAELQHYFPMSNSEAKDISHRIDKVTTTQPQTYQYFTYTQEAADKTAHEYAVKDKADYVIKTTEKVPVQGKSDGSDKLTGDKPAVYENKYYAVNMERKHAVSVGAAVVDKKAYAALSYRNRRTTVTAMYNPETKEAGGMVSYEVARW